MTIQIQWKQIKNVSTYNRHDFLKVGQGVESIISVRNRRSMRKPHGGCGWCLRSDVRYPTFVLKHDLLHDMTTLVIIVEEVAEVRIDTACLVVHFQLPKEPSLSKCCQLAVLITRDSYLVDPASSHMLVSKMKP